MRSSREPYVRRDSEYPWFVSMWILMALMVLLVPARIIWPNTYPAAAMLVLGVVALFIGAWTLSAGRRGVLQTHQVIANLGMMIGLVLFIIGLAVKAPSLIMWTLTVIVGCLAAVGVYRHAD
jgi:hypothetical protein